MTFLRFIRIYFGFFLQIAPFFYLCFCPFSEQVRHTWKQVNRFFICSLLLLDVIFTNLVFLFHAISPKYGNGLDNIAFLLVVIFYFAFYFHEVTDRIPKKLIVFFFSITVAQVLTDFINQILILFPSINTNDMYIYGGYFDLMQLFLLLPILPLCSGALIRYVKPLGEELSQKTWRKICAICSVLYLLFCLSFLIRAWNIRERSAVSSIALSLLLNFFAISLYVIIFITMHIMNENTRERRRLESALMSNKMQYQSMLENINAAKEIRHDVRHTMRLLQTLLAEQKYEDISALLDSYEANIHNTPVEKYCEHYVANCILNQYAEYSATHDITLQIAATLDDTIQIQDLDLCIMLGNLLENAVEACSKLPADARRITIRLKQQAQILALCIDNTYLSPPQKSGLQYLSTKNIPSGYGILSVKNITRKYNGSSSFTHDNGIFHVNISLFPSK